MKENKEQQIQNRLWQVVAWLPMFGIELNQDMYDKVYEWLAYEAQPLYAQLIIKQRLENLARENGVEI